jgi:hypothetical protein
MIRINESGRFCPQVTVQETHVRLTIMTVACGVGHRSKKANPAEAGFGVSCFSSNEMYVQYTTGIA